MSTLNEEQTKKTSSLLQAIREELSKAVIGQPAVLDEVLIGLLAGAHILLEGAPGLGKTLLVKALAKTFSGEFSRIQFTPDLMPSDVIGHAMFDMSNNQFVTRRGPVFTNLLLADEINRAPAKTQSALLEAMQEYQVTLEGNAHRLPQPFMVLATQNPIEQEGTYPLPEAQLDRFLLKIRIDYPDAKDEVALTRSVTNRNTGADLVVDKVNTLVGAKHIESLQMATALVDIDERVLDYAVAIVRATRDHHGFSSGAGPRGSIALIRAARGAALLGGRSFVTPDDIKRVALPALRHRVTTSPEAEIEGFTADTLLVALLDSVPAPRV
ncbi:MoxR family ATPase [Propionivibrio sp.]|uniref:AAA family ATPase n=1 Tax=Propionivibrio sp. TaxID=2212460 RepID=UPI00262F3371|nr:MoxR family ATPase [Propionivibrio sp.]